MNGLSRPFLALTFAAAVGVAGCSFNDDDDEVPPVAAAPAELPASAGASAVAFTGFIVGLGQNDDSTEPLVIRGDFILTADDDRAEPIILI